jgi:hypothetical protein
VSSYDIAYCPAETTLDRLIRVAGSRWAIEECSRARSRNVEIRRLITRLTDRRPTPVEHILHWTRWRRRRQHQGRTSHYKRRGHGP